MDTMNAQDIRDFQNAVYVFANAIGAMAVLLGMQTENSYCADRGEAVAYPEDAFYKLHDERGLHHNAILRAFSNE